MATQIESALKKSSPEVRAFVKHLLSENRRLQAKITKLESQYFTNKNRIAALEKQLKKGHVRVQIVRFAGEK